MISWKFRIFRNSQFSTKRPEAGAPSTKIPGNFKSYQAQKMQEYTGFPEFLSIHSEFSREIFTTFQKSRIFLNFRKPRNFGERVASTKKVPNFQFSACFSLNFVELIRYTLHPNLYTQLRAPKHVQTPKKLIFEDVGRKILENSRFFPKIGGPQWPKNTLF